VLTPLSDKRVVEKQEVSFECVFSKADKPATWKKQDKPITASDRVQIGVDGARHFLVIKSAVLDDEATYKIQVDSAQSSAKLTVEGQLDDFDLLRNRVFHSPVLASNNASMFSQCQFVIDRRKQKRVLGWPIPIIGPEHFDIYIDI